MRIGLFIVFLIATIGAQSQVLFTYGTQKINSDEFLRAYRKNNIGIQDEKSVRDYLDLYIRFKLKVQAAKDLRIDTLAGFKNEIAGFRGQLAEQYMANQDYSKEMIREAYERGMNELQVSHVFVAYNIDSSGARQTIDQAWQELKKGTDFGMVSRTYSSDDYVKATDGQLDYVTVFSLPYELENVIYGLKPGEYSSPVAGTKGWHIFKLANKRKDSGRMLAAQILFAIPEEASQEEKSRIQTKADSIYTLLKNGYSFEEAVKLFSNDKFTYQTGGVLPEFSYTDCDPIFAKAAFSLKKDGELSAPFQTNYGWHLVKRVSLAKKEKGLDDPETLQQWTDKVNASPRIKIVEQKHKEEMRKASGYKALPYDAAKLWVLSDSLLESAQYTKMYKDNRQKHLFQLKDKTISVEDWFKFVKNKQSLSAGGSLDGWEELMKEFTETTIEQYYKDRLEKMNPEFGYQMQEFTEGSLLFEVMEKNIWSKAPIDSSGLHDYYEQNRTKYTWAASADAIIFNCADTATANKAIAMMKTNSSLWKDYIEKLGGYAIADSGRFELSQLPVSVGTQGLQAGNFTPVETNTDDGSASFSFIIREYPNPEPRNFDAAKGLVINDYQQVLEERWMGGLKKKYPVKVNEPELQKIISGLKK
jgi:peptidyl-prolyl cis-trans isomerase SurA